MQMTDLALGVRCQAPTILPAMNGARRLILVLWACLLTGCAVAARPSSLQQQKSELSLHGDNTRLRIVIDRSESISPDEADQILADQEICYLTVDKATIECFPFGSLLMMGPNDAVQLVSDNPLDDLHANSQDPKGELLLRTLSMASLIADSVERLPGALADYVDSESTRNPGVARTLAHELLESSAVTLPGMSRAGAFKIVVELTEDGKETIRSALADRESGNLRYVRHLRRHAKNSGLTAETQRTRKNQ